jgi:hypothetical protein
MRGFIRGSVGFILLAWFVFSSPLSSQTQLVRGNFFPADLEFRELIAIRSEKEIKKPSDLASLEHGALLLEAGLERVSERTYQLVNPGTLDIRIFAFPDARNAYSALSLLGKPPLNRGLPGDYYSVEGAALLFSAGNFLVRIQSAEPGDLARRVAVSITNRIGNPAPKRPSIIRHLPTEGCDPAAARYFVGPLALGAYGSDVGGHPLKLPPDAEVTQTGCTFQGQPGTFTLISFPTIQIAEEYFNAGGVYRMSAGRGLRLYTRQTGPLVGILEGNFTPEVADKTLGSLQFSYSIKWIYEKNRPNRLVWGVPVKILGTVVRSIVFTGLLCAASILAGIALAFGRLYARRRWTRLEEHDSYIRLNLDEN